ncbi:MAG TPA: DUF3995 domain-containing protein, partial [Anaerolineales bacterium]|nr:DUF3995 domain-containing protein [Anaerolineales bacterium]
MNRLLLRFGGAINLLFVVLHLGLAGPMGQALAAVPPDIRASVSTLNISTAFALLIFGYLAMFRSRELLTTRLGHVTAIGIALFWFLRAITQVLFYGTTTAGMPLIAVCIAVGLMYLLPVLREWSNITGVAPQSRERPVDSLSRLQQRMAGQRWPRYAAIAWCVIFGGLHLYWALGGTAGFADFSMPSNRALALTRDPLYMGITWAVVIGCAVGIIVALAPFQVWSRRIPGWMLLTPLWIACGLFLVRGFGNLIQSSLIFAGGMPFEELTSADSQAWTQWLLIDAMFYSPWFILGGLAFGATAWSARRDADQVPGRQRARKWHQGAKAVRAAR